MLSRSEHESTETNLSDGKPTLDTIPEESELESASEAESNSEAYSEAESLLPKIHPTPDEDTISEIELAPFSEINVDADPAYSDDVELAEPFPKLAWAESELYEDTAPTPRLSSREAFYQSDDEKPDAATSLDHEAKTHVTMETGLQNGDTVQLFYDDSASDSDDEAEENDVREENDATLKQANQKLVIARDTLQSALTMVNFLKQKLEIATAEKKAGDEKLKFARMTENHLRKTIDEVSMTVRHGSTLLRKSDSIVSELRARNRELENIIQKQQTELAAFDKRLATPRAVSPAGGGLFKQSHHVTFQSDEKPAVRFKGPGQ